MFSLVSSTTHPGDDDSGDGDLNAGMFEQFVPQVDTVPEADDVTLDGDVVLAVKSEKGNIIVNNREAFVAL